MKKGFTLLEAVVVVAIISVLSLIGINSVNTFRQEAVIDNAVNEFVSEIKTARNKSMAGEVPEGMTADQFSSEGLPEYGIEVTGGVYKLVRSYTTLDGTPKKDTLSTSTLTTELILSPDGSVIFTRITGNTTPTSFNIQKVSSSTGEKVNIATSGLITIEKI